jgi:hypothetical protein
VLKRIFGPKRDEVVGGWKTNLIDELHNVNSSPNISRMINSRRIGVTGHVARKGKMNAYRILVRKPEGRRSLGRSRRRKKVNIKKGS